VYNHLIDPKPVILIVDDEPANLGTFARSFRKELVVRTAPSAADALAELQREPVDMLITDFTMPYMNGLELLREVAARWPTIVRMIVSGHADLQELHDAVTEGLAVELLPKPWHKAEILRVIERHLVPWPRPNQS
jgi:DNA-binding NtrC family response regulator